jgi:hypothetical protein
MTLSYINSRCLYMTLSYINCTGYYGLSLIRDENDDSPPKTSSTVTKNRRNRNFEYFEYLKYIILYNLLFIKRA